VTFKRIVVFSFLPALACGIALAQSFFGEIRGQIEDPHGAVVAGANVSLKNEATGTVSTTVSNSAGQYVFAQLEPATYTISVQVQGFKTLVRTGMIVGVQEKLGLDLKMELGDVTQSIAITAEAPLIETTTASNGTVTNTQQIADLPNLGRNTFLLAKVDNNVTPSGPPQWNRFEDQIGSSNLSINGGPIRGNNYIVDGVPITSSQNLAIFIPEEDSVQEMKLQEDTYDATMGRTGGGMFNVVLKTGGNGLHGNLMGYLRNTPMTANNFFNNAAGRRSDGSPVAPRPYENWENWGATLGGPVVIPHLYNGRNKTFFFVSTEGYLEDQPASGSYAVPTAAERAGNFSAAGKTIYDPNTNVPCSSGVSGCVQRSPFPGNIVPANRMNAVGQNILSYLPLPNENPNASVDQVNFAGEDTIAVHAEEHVFKLEEDPTSWLRLSGSFVYYKSHEPGGNTLEALPGSGSYLLDRHVDATALNAIATLNPTTVVTARFGFNRFPNIYNYVSQGFDQTKLGLPAGYVDALQVKEFPYVTMSQAGTNYGGTNPSNITYWSRNASFALSKNVGKHNLTAGFDYRLIHTDGLSWSTSEGTFGFNGIFTSSTNQSANGVDFADALLGNPASGSVAANSNEYFFIKYYSGYVQDDIRVNNKLTINAGLRYEYETGEAERSNHILVGFNQQAYNPIQAYLPAGSGVNAYGLPLIAGQNGNATDCCTALKDHLGPRAGFAYAINDKTIFRGGYGVFYAPVYFGFDNQYSPGLAQTTTYLASVDGNATAANSLSNPFPKGVLQPSSIQAGVMQQLGSATYFADQRRTQGIVQQFSADIQRQLPGGVALEIGYSGARSSDLQMGSTATAYLPLNQVPTQYLSMGSALSAKVANPFYGLPNVGGTLAGATVAQAQLLIPFPEYSQVYDSNNLGHAHYDSMIVKANKRMSRGLTFLWTFTWSKNEDNTYGGPSSNYFISNSGSTAPSYPQNVYNLGAEWGLAGGTTPWRSTATWTYQLPFGKGQPLASNVNSALDYLIGGWSVNGVMTLSSGFPLFVYQTNNNSTIGALEQRPNATGVSPDKSGNPESRINQYLNPGAFSMAPAYTFGNVSRAIPMYGPGMSNWDISLFKTVKVHERFRAQFRAEALNAFNTPLFANPNVNFQGFTASGAPSGNFGRITYQMNLPRELQLGLRLMF
jgi:hypothetical protein